MIETERLILREYTPEDFDALYEIMSDPETMAHYPSPFDEARTRRWIEWNLENYAQYGFGLWAVILKETGEFIGDCGLTLQSIDGEMLPEIGYHIHKKYWRRGFAKEAAQAVRDWAFLNTKYDTLYSYMKYTNEGSWRTAMANGMRKVKEYPDPKNTISYAFAINREEWKEKSRMSNIEKYRQYFTKDYLMGPNSFRLLDELIRRKPSDVPFHRALDLGCGFALTSFFIANETDAGYVYAYDLWIPASENYQRIRESHLEDRIIPIHGDAMEMPFAQNFFDAILSVDAYHYFGCKEGVFAEKILPFVKKGGYVMIAIPGLKEQPQGELKQLFETWAEGDDAQLFKTVAWWEALLKYECGETCDITVKEAECFDIAWKEWFDSGHEYGARDKEFLEKGLDKILNFILIYVRKN